MLNIKKRLNNRILVSVDNDVYDTIVELAQKYNCSISEVTRAILEKGLEHND